jgi:ribosomal protein L40E
MNAPKPQQHTLLTEDGELQPADGDQAAMPEARLSAVFCTNCGTANPASSRFCRSCGQSLDEQVINPASLETYAPPQQKGKRDASARQRSPQPQTPLQVIGSLIGEIVSLLIMGGLVVWAVNAGQGVLAVFIFVGWFFMEMSRRGWMDNTK